MPPVVIQSALFAAYSFIGAVLLILCTRWTVRTPLSYARALSCLLFTVAIYLILRLFVLLIVELIGRILRSPDVVEIIFTLSMFLVPVAAFAALAFFLSEKGEIKYSRACLSALLFAALAPFSWIGFSMFCSRVLSIPVSAGIFS